MAKINSGGCGCGGITPCSPVTCTSPTDPTCEVFTLNSSNTESPTGVSDVSDVTLNVKRISAFKDHLEFVNSPSGLSSIVGHTVLRLSTRFLNGITNLFRGRNVGTGAKLYKGLKVEGADTFQDFRTLKGSESIVVNEGTDEVTVSVDPNWLNGELPTVDYPVISGESVGTGTPLYKGLVGKKIQVSTITSDDFIISDFEGGLKINSPGGGTNSSFWYINNNYTRPLNWTAFETVTNSDIGASALPCAKGSLNDPFKTYQEFLARAIGPKAVVHPVNGDPVNRENPRTGGTLQILSDISTDQTLEINNWNVVIKNRSRVEYTGNDEYALDMRNIISKALYVGPILKRTILVSFGGEGTFTRSKMFGLIYSKSSIAFTDRDTSCRIDINSEGSGFFIIEPFNDDTIPGNPNVHLTRSDGTTLLYNGNGKVKGRVQAVTTPLITVDGKTTGYWGTIFNGPLIFIQPCTQAGIKIINGGNCTSSTGLLMYQVSNNVVGYQTKMIEGAPGNSADDNIFLGLRKEGGENGFYYKSSSDYVMFDIGANCVFRVENLATVPNGFLFAGFSYLIRVGDGGTFNNIVSWSDTGGGTSVVLIKALTNSSSITISGLKLQSVCDVFVEGTGANAVGVTMTNTQINGVRVISRDLSLLQTYTNGTVSSLQGNPLVNLVMAADNTAALAGGLIKNMLYRNTTTNEITQVV